MWISWNVTKKCLQLKCFMNFNILSFKNNAWPSLQWYKTCTRERNKIDWSYPIFLALPAPQSREIWLVFDVRLLHCCAAINEAYLWIAKDYMYHQFSIFKTRTKQGFNIFTLFKIMNCSRVPLWINTFFVFAYMQVYLHSSLLHSKAVNR